MFPAIGIRRFLWGVLCGCVLALGREAAAAPTVQEVLAPLQRQREAVLAEPSRTFVFTVASTVHVPGTYAYSGYSVTDRQRGTEYHVTAEFPPGSRLAPLPDSSASPADSPGRTVEYSYLQGTAYDRDQHKLWITPEPLTQHFRYHDFTDAQHINVYAGLAMPGGRMMPYEPSRPYVPDVVLKNLARYSVRDEPEVVNGAACFVLESPGLDVMWIDETGNLHQREQHWGPGEALSLVTTAQDFRQRKEGIWLPEVIETQHFDNPRQSTPRPNGVEGTPNQPNYRLKITLKSVSFEPLTDQDLAVAKAKDGVQVTDFRGKEYLSSKPIEQPSVSVTSVAKPPEGTGETRPPAFRNLLLASGLLVVVVAVSFVMWRRLVYRSRPGGSAVPGSTRADAP